MEAEDLLDRFAQDEGFGNWETVVLNCHHSVIRAVAIAAVNQALRQPLVMGSCSKGKGIEYDKQYLYDMYNATSTEDETYENWLERQLISRIERLEQLRQPPVSASLPSESDLQAIVERIAYERFGEEQAEDCYAKMGLLYEFVKSYVVRQ